MHTTTGTGRPRSQQARTAVLHAVDDLLVEVGYAAMTMKGIAERAGVGRQTVYRWWSTKAEILLEAMVADAQEELDIVPTGTPVVDLGSYLDVLVQFLTTSTAGHAYRALLGEAQHDPTVAALFGARNVLFSSARVVLEAVADARRTSDATLTAAAAMLTGPVLLWIVTGQDPADLPREHVIRSCLALIADPGA